MIPLPTCVTMRPAALVTMARAVRAARASSEALPMRVRARALRDLK